jgi:hypothetical protein
MRLGIGGARMVLGVDRQGLKADLRSCALRSVTCSVPFRVSVPSHCSVPSSARELTLQSRRWFTIHFSPVVLHLFRTDIAFVTTYIGQLHSTERWQHAIAYFTSLPPVARRSSTAAPGLRPQPRRGGASPHEALKIEHATPVWTIPISVSRTPQALITVIFVISVVFVVPWTLLSSGKWFQMSQTRKRLLGDCPLANRHSVLSFPRAVIRPCLSSHFSR